MIEPLNEDNDNLFDMGNFVMFHGTFEEQQALIAEMDENDIVTLTWRNANITVRAGTAKAWFELAQIQ